MSDFPTTAEGIRELQAALAACEAREATLRAERDRLTERLKEGIFVVNGTVQHLYGGSCPDSVEGPESRDPDCPACRWLDRALAAVSPKEEGTDA